MEIYLKGIKSDQFDTSTVQAGQYMTFYPWCKRATSTVQAGQYTNFQSTVCKGYI